MYATVPGSRRGVVSILSRSSLFGEKSNELIDFFRRKQDPKQEHAMKTANAIVETMQIMLAVDWNGHNSLGLGGASALTSTDILVSPTCHDTR
jgi:hypothetical protein